MNYSDLRFSSFDLHLYIYIYLSSLACSYQNSDIRSSSSEQKSNRLFFQMYRLCLRRSASTFSLQYTTKNEPILEYRRGNAEVQQLQTTLNQLKSQVTRIPCIIDGKEIWTNTVQQQILPFDHQHVLAEYCYADRKLLQSAIDSAVKRQRQWNATPIEERANIFLKVTGQRVRLGENH